MGEDAAGGEHVGCLLSTDHVLTMSHATDLGLANWPGGQLWSAAWVDMTTPIGFTYCPWLFWQ
jgi:hypothetical protein